MPFPKQTIVTASTLLAAQVGVTAAIYFSRWGMVRHWREVLASQPLPSVTTIALQYGLAIPVIATVLTLAVVLITAKAKTQPLSWFFYIVIAETMALSAYISGIIQPTLSILFRLQN